MAQHFAPHFWSPFLDVLLRSRGVRRETQKYGLGATAFHVHIRLSYIISLVNRPFREFGNFGGKGPPCGFSEIVEVERAIYEHPSSTPRECQAF